MWFFCTEGIKKCKIWIKFNDAPCVKNRSKLFGYNSGMKNIEEKVIANFEIIKNNVYDKFSTVWQSEKHFTNHIDKRVLLGHVIDEKDYITKTLKCLSESKECILAQHKKSWDNICYNHNKSWAVIFNEHGKIMTSYKIEPKSKSFESSQSSIKAKITKGVPNEKFRNYFKQLPN